MGDYSMVSAYYVYIQCTCTYTVYCTVSTWFTMLSMCSVHATAGLLEEVKKRLDKLVEPPPMKAIKPLPRPDDAPRKKRGGRRWVGLSSCMQKFPPPLAFLWLLF